MNYGENSQIARRNPDFAGLMDFVSKLWGVPVKPPVDLREDLVRPIIRLVTL